MRVLIVDDDENQRNSLALALEANGYAVVVAPDAAHALAALEEGRPVHVAVVDLMMPGTSGLELARELGFKYPEIRIYLSSAYHLSERQLARAGCRLAGFIPKPVPLDALCSTLRAEAERRFESTPPLGELPSEEPRVEQSGELRTLDSRDAPTVRPPSRRNPPAPRRAG